jgi:two-component system, NtrC family, sensor histidine kinase HydH
LLLIRRDKTVARPGSSYLSFSPWILAVAGVLLLVLLGLFGFSNYQREKELLGTSMEQRGLTLMRFINSAAREGMRQRLRSGDESSSWEESVTEAMKQATEQPGVVSVLLVEQNGKIRASVGVELDGKSFDGETLEMLANLSRSEGQGVLSRVVAPGQSATHGYRFQMVAWQVIPRPSEHFADSGGYGMGRRMQMMRRTGENPPLTAWQEELRQLRERPLIYLIELDFQHFSGSLKRQVMQLVLLTVVIVLVGIGGALAFMTLKGLRGSQQRLGAMRAFTDRLVSSLPLGVIATDSHGLIRLCNASAAALLNVKAESMHGKTPQNCLPPQLACQFGGSAQGERCEQPQEVVLGEGAKNDLILQVLAMAVSDEQGRLEGEVLLVRDLSEIRSLEKELRRNERLAALGKMAAGVAHEVRNPLSSIKGLAMILKERRNNEEAEESADLLVKEVERLNRSISELLDYARPAKLQRGMAAPAEIVGKAVSLVQADASSLGIKISTDVSADLPEVCVDVDKINQVMLNLLLNGVQAMPQGGNFTISAKADGANLLLSLCDTGEGIAMDHLPRVFDPYFTTKSNGTGLGLAISAKIVEEHGGSIHISSHEGEGTEVCLQLPLPGGTSC